METHLLITIKSIEHQFEIIPYKYKFPPQIPQKLCQGDKQKSTNQPNCLGLLRWHPLRDSEMNTFL